ncbi:MAG TPA: helix-turn-helix domain-containing protein [Cerasibacillus sp.]|uniref:helix-turn-helix transcriptional regulator n=1 Tax=Cerasibacillus sp. TaxID=2498711 RepID=UPI002F412860
MQREFLIRCRGKKSRQEVANDLSITTQMLGMLERGDRTPSLELAKKISEYYQEPIEKLFFNQKGNVLFPKEKKEIVSN